VESAHQTSSATSRPTGDWLSTGRFAVFLGLLILASYPKVVPGFETFVVRDYGFFAYPLAHFQREAFWGGEVPLWNPYNNCGVPFLAQWNTMPLYPPALLYLLPPLELALGAFSLLHLWFGGLGMYLLARGWTGSRYGAAVAGVMFAFNGLSLNMLMWPSHIATLSWMPWVVLWVQRGWLEGGRSMRIAALVGALQMLAGGPETILLTWLLLSLLWLGDLWRQGRAGLRRPATWRFPLMVLLVAGLAAAQLLPFMDLAAHSQREGGYADSRWALPAWGWVNFFVPLAFGRVWNMGVFFQHGQAWTSSYYLGVGGLALALTGMLAVRDRRASLLAVWSGVLLLLAFGDQSLVTRWLREAVPALTAVTYPVKFVTGIVMAAPLLAGFAAARWTDRTGTRWRQGLLLLGSLSGAAIIGIVLWVQAAPLPNDDTALAVRSGWERGIFLLAIVLLLLGAKQTFGGWLQRVAPTAVLLLLWLDVLTHAPNQNPSVEPWVYAPGLARAKLKLEPSPEQGGSRVMVSPAAEKRFTDFSSPSIRDNFVVKRLGYFANCNLLDNTPKVNGFFSLYPRESGELASVLYANTNLFYPPLMDFMGVSHVTAPDSFAEWRLRRAWMPLATIGQQPIFLADTAALETICHTNFNPRSVVILPPDTAGAVLNTNGAAASVTSFTMGREKIEVKVKAEAATLLVLAQTYYHPWRAYVDGAPAPLLRANYAFQAVPVPAGEHTVRVVYEDKKFQAGLGLTSITALAVVLLIFWRRPELP
jgi:hypothetical protein